MEKVLKYICFLAIYLIASNSQTFAQFSNKASWHDEFRKSGSPNSMIWKRSVSNPDKQLSGYCDNDSNAYVKRGLLHLRLFKSSDSNKTYKSGRVITEKTFWFKKGRITIRAKAPISAGTWAAIWFSGPNTSKGFHAELDLMEHIKSMGDSQYTAVYHLWGNFRGDPKNHVSYGHNVPVKVNKWHVYSLEITDDCIVMKVDKKPVYIIRKGEYGDEWPEDQEYSLRLALAYGGYGATKTGTDDSALPAEMLVDYVRFYPIIEK